MIYGIITNKIVVSVFFATIVCQVWKIISQLIINKKFDISVFLSTGGMPSSHASFVSALAVSIGLLEGFDSTVFFLATGLALIVIRDAFGVRRTVDTVRETVNEIIRTKKLGMHQIRKIAGHTPVQVIVGMLVGVAVPVIISFVY